MICKDSFNISSRKNNDQVTFARCWIPRRRLEFFRSHDRLVRISRCLSTFCQWWHVLSRGSRAMVWDSRCRPQCNPWTRSVMFFSSSAFRFQSDTFVSDRLEFCIYFVYYNFHTPTIYWNKWTRSPRATRITMIHGHWTVRHTNNREVTRDKKMLQAGFSTSHDMFSYHPFRIDLCVGKSRWNQISSSLECRATPTDQCLQSRLVEKEHDLVSPQFLVWSFASCPSPVTSVCACITLIFIIIVIRSRGYILV